LLEVDKVTHPIIPPPELIEQWFADWESSDNEEVSFAEFVVSRATRWGADQELEACCEWVKRKNWIEPEFAGELRAARRPKPSSLKQRALEAMHRNWNPHNNDDFATISRALEQLDD
jgi:hypothetical protein